MGKNISAMNLYATYLLIQYRTSGCRKTGSKTIIILINKTRQKTSDMSVICLLNYLKNFLSLHYRYRRYRLLAVAIRFIINSSRWRKQSFLVLYIFRLLPWVSFRAELQLPIQCLLKRQMSTCRRRNFHESCDNSFHGGNFWSDASL